MDVTNPGLVNVADEAEGNPDPNGGTARATPRESGELVPVADQGATLDPGAGVASQTFPTPTEVEVGAPTPSAPVQSDVVPDAAEVDVEAQSIGQGGMRPVDPADPAAGYEFVPPAEFVVVGPADSFQTNTTSEDEVTVTVAAVFDADNLFNAPGPSTTRYYLRLATPPLLSSYPVSLLGRQVIFGDASSNPGAVRTIASYGGNFVVVNREDLADQTVPELAQPLPGDTLEVDVQRRGSEPVSSTGSTVDVTVAPTPEPPVVVQAPVQDSSGTFAVSTGPQPAPAPPVSGTLVPSATTVEVANQCQVVGLPSNVFV